MRLGLSRRSASIIAPKCADWMSYSGEFVKRKNGFCTYLVTACSSSRPPQHPEWAGGMLIAAVHAPPRSGLEGAACADSLILGTRTLGTIAWSSLQADDTTVGDLLRMLRVALGPLPGSTLTHPVRPLLRVLNNPSTQRWAALLGG